jgi:hypothetical protein
MPQAELTVTLSLTSPEAPPDKQRSATFEELRRMFKLFRRQPFTTNGNHDPIFITAIREIPPVEAPPLEAPD